MAKGSNIVHQYFKRDFDGYKILLKLNPLDFTGTEITRYADGNISLRDLEFDKDILEDLKVDGFAEASPLEFNLYLSGLAS